MTLKNKIRNFMLGLYTYGEVIDYYRAMYRNCFYDTKCAFILRKHVRGQIEFRMKYIKKECKEQGSCIYCGCVIPELQMANSSCKGYCYPSMLKKKLWEDLKNGELVLDGKTHLAWHLEEEKLVKKPIVDLIEEELFKQL